jgi:hypothetical protein
MEKKKMTLFEKTNNPLNLQYNEGGGRKQKIWIGELSYNSIISPKYRRFESPMWGFRAGWMFLYHFASICKELTIERIASLPGIEAAVDKNYFINWLCINCHKDSKAPIDFNDQVGMLVLVSAVVTYLHGEDYNPQKRDDLWRAMYFGYKCASAQKLIDDKKKR